MKNKLINLALPTKWKVYILEDGVGRLYTGASTDPRRRLREHGTNRGAKSLRGRAPFTLRWISKALGVGEALRMEYAVKRLPRKERLKIIAGEREAPTEVKSRRRK